MPAKTVELLANPAIVRNRFKMVASTQHPKAFLRVQDEFGIFEACYHLADWLPHAVDANLAQV